MKSIMDRNFTKFIEKWRCCKLCPLHEHAKQHVVYRGDVPAELLFIGEAPGKVENTLGKPFVGLSGQILNNTVARLAITSFGVTNIVCCIPWLGDNPDTKQIRQPSDGEAGTCSPHIIELIKLTQPKLIVCLGEVAKRHLGLFLPQENKVPVAHLRHPAYVLRRGGIDSAEHKKLILGLQNACLEHDVDHIPYFNETSFSKIVETN